MRVQWREAPNSRMGFFRHTFRMWLAFSALTALAACGGGGGGGGGNPAPANPPANPPANAAPQVNAGADQTIQLPTNSVTLSGSATDAPGSTLTYAWTSSPADGVTFSNAAAAETTATFAAAGTYTVTLSVSDGSLSGTDTAQIVVQPAASNAAPVVDAGADQSVELPVNSVTLTGTATDADSTSLTYAWTAEPAAGVTFADATAVATTATFTDAGTYVLTLAASDGAQSTSDTLQVVVSPAVYPAADTNETDPARGWAVATPADVGMDEALLAQARTRALEGGGAGAIVRRGRLVYSWGDIDVRYDVKSTTKSIGGIALGLAIDDGEVALTDLAQTHLPTFITTPPQRAENVATGWLDDITLLQLATHTAGFEKPGGYGLLVREPGTTWLYSDGALNWLADALTQAFAEDLSSVLTRRVWSVLGINTDDVQWRANALRPADATVYPDGIPRRELASGIVVNTNAMARVGLLFLRNGVWDGQPVLSQSFIDTVRAPRPELANVTIDDATNFPNATTNYGVLWWTNATGMLPNVPRDAYWAWGLGDSLIVVIPSLDLVIARTGNSPDVAGLPRWRNNWNGDYSVLAPFLDPIVQSVQQ